MDWLTNCLLYLSRHRFGSWSSSNEMILSENAPTASEEHSPRLVILRSSKMPSAGMWPWPMPPEDTQQSYVSANITSERCEEFYRCCPHMCQRDKTRVKVKKNLIGSPLSGRHKKQQASCIDIDLPANYFYVRCCVNPKDRPWRHGVREKNGANIIQGWIKSWPVEAHIGWTGNEKC